jgi:prolyl 4-hydroxylase
MFNHINNFIFKIKLVMTFTKDWINWIETNKQQGNDKGLMVKKLLENNFNPLESSQLVYGNERTNVPQKWQNWISDNVEKGVSKKELYQILLSKGFLPDDIKNYLDYNPIPLQTNELALILDKDSSFLSSYKALSEIKLANSYRHPNSNVLLYIIDDFLEADLCQELCRRIKKRNRQSTVTNDNEPDKEYRTSKTCDFELSDPFIKKIDKQICDYISIPTERSETIQGQYYQVGNQFKSHTDWFDPNNNNEWSRFGEDMGQRTWTFMIYLNNVDEGGETYFPKLDLRVEPKQGRAVVWYNLHPDGKGNQDTLHWGTPVKQGEKYIITKWFRTRGTHKDPYRVYLPNQIKPYTRLGYHKYQLSPSLFQTLQSFYQTQGHTLQQETGFAIGNYILSKNDLPPTYVLPITPQIESQIKNQLLEPLEQWSQTKLEWTAIYGIREYKRDSYLKMHVDRYETHIISVIINVEQQVEQDWPLVIIDHYGRTHDIILKPGEVLFYESAKCYHGRPYPLKGDRYANIFAHTRPRNWNPQHFKNRIETNSMILE